MRYWLEHWNSFPVAKEVVGREEIMKKSSTKIRNSEIVIYSQEPAMVTVDLRRMYENDWSWNGWTNMESGKDISNEALQFEGTSMEREVDG